MKKTNLFIMVLIGLITVILGGCAAVENNSLKASGFLSAVEASVSPELSGKVVSIAVKEGDSVSEAQPLLRIDDAFLMVQRDQAAAAVSTSEAGLQAAQANLASAQAQYELTLQSVRIQDMEARQNAWLVPVNDYEKPAWYYTQSEKITAVNALVDDARIDLNLELENLQKVLKSASSKDFLAVETRLAEAQFAAETARKILDRAELTGDDPLVDYGADRLDEANVELDAARLEYKNLLTTSAAETVMEARARVAVSQSTLDSLQDTLLMMQTGDQSLQVNAVSAAVQAAEAAVAQAKGGMAQAKEALRMADLQLERAEVKAPVSGTVLSRTIEIGELAAAGGVVMRIAPLDTLELIVYLPEDKYGRVNLGDSVIVTVDSFPSRSFSGNVIYISDEAEFTPRNVQTEEGRKATTYAVKIQIENSDHALKPGMPADVDFDAQ